MKRQMMGSYIAFAAMEMLAVMGGKKSQWRAPSHHIPNR